MCVFEKERTKEKEVGYRYRAHISKFAPTHTHIYIYIYICIFRRKGSWLFLFFFIFVFDWRKNHHKTIYYLDLHKQKCLLGMDVFRGLEMKNTFSQKKQKKWKHEYTFNHRKGSCIEVIKVSIWGPGTIFWCSYRVQKSQDD